MGRGQKGVGTQQLLLDDGEGQWKAMLKGHVRHQREATRASVGMHDLFVGQRVLY